MVRSSGNPDRPDRPERSGSGREPERREPDRREPERRGQDRRERTGAARAARGGQRPRPERPPAKAGRPSEAVYAALDLGTNNCRLLVAHPTAVGFRVVDAFSRIVRLGEGVAAQGRLSEAAIRRTLAALRICANKMRRAGVTRTRAVATEACRQADNCAEFLQRVYHETEIELEIISAEEEAHLGLQSCLALLDEAQSHALLFDIGGGSTELSWVEFERAVPRLRASQSFPLGVVGLTERFGLSGRDVPAAVYRRMSAEVAEALAPFEARHDLGRLIGLGDLQMLGTSGTVTTLTGVHKQLDRYDRGQVDGTHLGLSTVAELSQRIAAMTYAERLADPCIGAQRADLVIAGCAILEAICRLWPVERLCVADRGLREGMLLTLMAGDKAMQGALRGPVANSPQAPRRGSGQGPGQGPGRTSAKPARRPGRPDGPGSPGGLA